MRMFDGERERRVRIRLRQGTRVNLQADTAEKRKDAALIHGTKRRIAGCRVEEVPQSLLQNPTVQAEHAGAAHRPVTDQHHPPVRSDPHVRQLPSLAANGLTPSPPWRQKSKRDPAKEMPGHNQIAPYAIVVRVLPGMRI